MADAQDEPDPALERRVLAGWQIEQGYEGDDGRMVRMVRGSAGHRLQFEASFWRGNGGPIFRVAAERSGRPCGAEAWRSGWGVPAAAADLRGRLAVVLRACGASDSARDDALSGFERAYPLAATWIARAEAAVRAEMEAILAHGADTFEVLLWAGPGAERSPGFVASGSHPCGAVATIAVSFMPPHEEGADVPLGTELVAELDPLSGTGDRAGQGGAGGAAMRWSVPVDYRPVALSGARLLIDHGGQQLWIDTGGNLERDPGTLAAYPPIESIPCPRDGPLAGSDYARCAALIDLASGDRRRIQYEGPCT